ncbi:unnamed protein product [Closterium sp. NIES-64]|nr:unnamed protein product [Closterium sp. NIES-64]
MRLRKRIKAANARDAEEKDAEMEIKLWRGVVRRGDTVVDATCGNGHDTMAMAALALAPAPPSDGDAGSAGEEVRGRVVAMDIQERRQSAEPIACWQLACQRCRWLTCTRLVAFNLGYLPRAHHAPPTTAPSPAAAPEGITTQPPSTVAALQAAVAAQLWAAWSVSWPMWATQGAGESAGCGGAIDLTRVLVR